MRDFNEVAGIDEKVASGITTYNDSCLKNWMEETEMTETKSTGVSFTWCSQQEGHDRIYCKLRTDYLSTWRGQIFSTKLLLNLKST